MTENKEKRTQEAPAKAPEKPVEPSVNTTATETKHYNLGVRELKSGDRGEDVSALQRKLGLNPTGILNAETEKKVKYLQRIRGLNETGIVDKELLYIIR
jgi:peptidoglycan hydrolase-like protein with peptidoglycan-binding domain